MWRNPSSAKSEKSSLKYILLKLDYNFSSLCYSAFSIFQIKKNLPSPWRISHVIWHPLADLSPPFVDYASYYSSACPVRHPPKSSVSCDNQNSTVQRSSPYKCGQGVWWGALNMVAATIPPITPGLTPSLKLFLYSVVHSCNVLLMWPWPASPTLPSECMDSSELYWPPWP